MATDSNFHALKIEAFECKRLGNKFQASNKDFASSESFHESQCLGKIFNATRCITCSDDGDPSH